MTNEEQDEKLYQMGLELGYVSGLRDQRRAWGCKHEQSTLCVHTEPGLDTLVAWQCDACGMVLDRDVTLEEVYTPDLPLLDGDMWNDSIQARLGGDLSGTLAFWSSAIRR